MQSPWTNIKDVDLEIMMKMDDRALFNTCQSSKYFKDLCANETFWKRRTMMKYPKILEREPRFTKIVKEGEVEPVDFSDPHGGPIAEQLSLWFAKTRLVELNWRETYLYLTYWINKLKEEFKYDTSDLQGDPSEYYTALRENKQGVTDLLETSTHYGFRDLMKYAFYEAEDENVAHVLVAAKDVDTIHYLEKLYADYEEPLQQSDYQDALDFAQDFPEHIGVGDINPDILEYLEKKANQMDE